ncbi:MAG: alpha/beta hydrolase, partial [Rhodothermia bacterium]|nr:alpha/beta hydrolase [Rhodothermia bacterium]
MQPNSELVLRFLKPIFYRHVHRPESTILRDVPYVSNGTERQHLDLYLPDSDVDDWPVLIFVHGGGWSAGDRKLLVAGEDVYGNIGRYYATEGFGCAVISYRLLPDVHWREQFSDVAKAVGWVQQNVGHHGGNAEQTILVGHSAGAHLCSRVALDKDLLAAAGGWSEYVRGVISASGAGFDMVDETTYQLGADLEYLRERFGQFETPADWQYEAS